MKDRYDLERLGFGGFLSVRSLKETALDQVPEQPGVYVVLRESAKFPRFAAQGTGGRSKDKNPNVDLHELRKSWVLDTRVVYIGKAGGIDQPPTLRTRIRQYLDFGNGLPVAHWGGRYIWQLEDSDTLTVCWRVIHGRDPEDVEADLIEHFVDVYGRLPFANLKRGRRLAKP